VTQHGSGRAVDNVAGRFAEPPIEKRLRVPVGDEADVM
jgi:hypothetical protein